MRLLDIMNKIRLSITGEFKGSSNPSPNALFGELLKLEVLLMENRNKEDLDLFSQ